MQTTQEAGWLQQAEPSVVGAAGHTRPREFTRLLKPRRNSYDGLLAEVLHGDGRDLVRDANRENAVVHGGRERATVDQAIEKGAHLGDVGFVGRFRAARRSQELRSSLLGCS